MRDVARYVENREWPATLDLWRPWPGERPAAWAVTEIRRRARMLDLAIAPALLCILCGALIAALMHGDLVDVNGWGMFTAIAVMVLSGAVFGILLLYRGPLPLDGVHRRRLEIIQKFITTIKHCMGALHLDISAIVLRDERTLKELIDGFLLVQGMGVVAHETSILAVAGLSAANLARNNEERARQQLNTWVTKFGNLMLLEAGAQADDYIARGRQAIRAAGQLMEVPVQRASGIHDSSQ